MKADSLSPHPQAKGKRSAGLRNKSALSLLNICSNLTLLDSPDLNVRDRNQAGLHHFFDDGGQTIDILGGIHNGNNNGQVVLQ